MRLAMIAAASLIGLAAAADEHGTPTIAQMGFLTGDWVETRNGFTTEEHWVGPVGGVMAGIAITHSDKAGKKTRIEFMSIVERDGTLVFIARPDGQDGGEFTLKTSDNGIATFENAAHDFPQRITYEIAGDDLDTLKARIEGTVNGKERAMDWTYSRVAPPAR